MRELLQYVNPVLVTDCDKNKYYGSSFTTTDGFIRTAWHVVYEPKKDFKSVVLVNDQQINISPASTTCIDFNEFEYKYKLSENDTKLFKMINIAPNKPNRGDIVYVVGMASKTKQIAIKVVVSISKFEQFDVLLSSEYLFNGFSGGLVANEQMQAIGICSGQLGKGLACQYITKDKYSR